MHVEKNKENKAGDKSELSLDSCSSSQAALEQIVTCFLVVHNVLEFRFHQLTVVVSDKIFERIFKALKALAFVAAVFKAAALNWNTLKDKIKI